MTDYIERKKGYDANRVAFAAESAKFRDSTISEIDFILSDIITGISGTRYSIGYPSILCMSIY